MHKLCIPMLCMLLLAACHETEPAAKSTPPMPAGAVTAGEASALVVPQEPAMSSEPRMVAEKRSLAAVRQVVAAFGEQLKQVSLLAAPDQVRQQLRAHYAPLVTPELLQRWISDPASAPGRKVSSPWPDRIDVADATAIAPDKYAVVGVVRYADSSGAARTEPVRIEVERKPGGTWRVSAYRVDTGMRDQS